MKKAILAAAFALICLIADAQELIVIKSEHLKCDDSILVFTPSKYQCTEEYCVVPDGPLPTLFLLHGWSGCYSNWSKKSDLQDFADRYGFRIICPDGFYNSWYVNSLTEDGMQWRTFFDEELYPQMQDRFDFVADSTFITGLSMGGHGAINIFMDDTTRFKAAGSMSGVLDIHHTNLIESQVTKVLGPYSPDSEAYNSQSAVQRLESMKGCTKLMIATCGYNDFYCKCTREFDEKCCELGIPHITIYSPATHSWRYWDFALDLHLKLFTKIMRGDNLGY